MSAIPGPEADGSSGHYPALSYATDNNNEQHVAQMVSYYGSIFFRFDTFLRPYLS